jgi:serine/threonine-protein kinase HipA
VFLYRKHLGVLTRGTMTTVALQFDRSPDLESVLSLSMPTTPSGRYSADKASPYFNGLLPDGSDARLLMAQAYGSLDASTFSLLSRGGLDCAGAVQVWTDEALPPPTGTLEALSEVEVGARLRASMSARGDDLRDDIEHWSLSGAQRKIALRLEDGRWHLPTGSEPSSHILKPGVTSMPGVEPGDQALVEHVTMEAARSLGIETATTAYTEFDGVAAVVVQRFDRERIEGELSRVHQEDMCQALGVDSASKYEDDGGPGAARIAAALWGAIPEPTAAERAIRSFTAMVAFNYMVEGSDAHAKNFALLHPRGGDTRLAPMYDAATGALASRPDGARRFPRSAMRIGGQDRFGSAQRDDWLALLRDVRLRDDEALLAQFRHTAAHVADAMSTALEASAASSHVKKRVRATRVLDRIAESSSAARKALGERSR